MALKFSERLNRAHTRQPTAWSASASIRTRPGFPRTCAATPQPLLAFNRRIVDATADLCAAYKPQIAFYSALGKEDELAASIRYIRERAPAALVILDAKRGDIGNTAEAYAREAFERYGADAVTVNPYMGEDSVLPFLARPDRGAILLCRTSNPGGHDFQDLVIDGLPLTAESRSAQPPAGTGMAISCSWSAPRVRRRWPNCGARTPSFRFLVPGIGAQGGDLEATLAAGLDARRQGTSGQLFARRHLRRRAARARRSARRRRSCTRRSIASA